MEVKDEDYIMKEDERIFDEKKSKDKDVIEVSVSEDMKVLDIEFKVREEEE